MKTVCEILLAIFVSLQKTSNFVGVHMCLDVFATESAAWI